MSWIRYVGADNYCNRAELEMKTAGLDRLSMLKLLLILFHNTLTPILSCGQRGDLKFSVQNITEILLFYHFLPNLVSSAATHIFAGHIIQLPAFMG